ncbi:hypothetical protein GOP47_0002348 [Adiantum capillus-veneris]|uniref:Bifunctional inhibitor/plant lipid transfer protein/seed storage helical domain-containing protein n=1 Tax=Adiantum capillus-veneris TaxID=13818 RepID=A0A9D4V9Y7_ADICA|nr:hypothetical protein GOP47_0002348 [Adiantum capillus-veneris]
MEGTRRLTHLVMVVMVVMLVAGGPWIVSIMAACPSYQELYSQCSKYVIGSNPPAPTANSGCCSLLKSSSPSCVCSAIPSNYKNLVNQKGLSNVKSVCKISASC